jgi:hypothetical protein
MIDAAVSATHSVGTPEVSVTALMDLRQLLNALDRPQGNAHSSAPPEVEHEESS